MGENMKSAFFKEIKKYTHQQIRDKLKISDSETDNLIVRLILDEVIKKVKADGKQGTEYYIFYYVGVIIYDDIVIKCFPKYISKADKTDTLKTIVAVLQKYGEREKVVEAINGIDDNAEFNLLSVVLFILSDFVDNGVYSNQKDITTLDGNGEIDWDKTINETYAVISNKKPLYLEMYTKNAIDDDADYFRQLHMYVISNCSNILKDTGLDEIFALPYFDFKIDETLFTDDEVVLAKIAKELNVQFVNRKQLVLKTLYAFISHNNANLSEYRLSLFGTNNFNIVWEKVCAFVFNNQLNKPLNGLNIKLVDEKYNRSEQRLIDIVKKPIWSPLPNDIIKHQARRTLVPDIISVYEDSGKKYFIISDAKYYLLRLNETELEGNPGVEDVSKQHLYALAYKEFIESNAFDVVDNVFLFPSENEGFELVGTVEMDLFEGLGIGCIKLLKLPAYTMFQNYLRSKHLQIGNYI